MTGAPKRLKLLLTAVEASADALGAALMDDLRARSGGAVDFIGVGGARMTAAGLNRLFDPDEMAVVGAFNALAVYPKVLRRARQVAELAAREQPDAAVLIDAWGFSLRVARGVRRLAPGVKIIKYVAPQVWATRPGRARTLARTVDALLTLHGFDAPYFEPEGLATTFVGNPALTRDFSAADGLRLRARLGIAADAPMLLVLPGSRSGEIRRMTPPFAEASDLLRRRRPDLQIVVAAAETVEDEVRAGFARWAAGAKLITGERDRLSAMRTATAALACSGTVTTELAMAGCPFVVGYRLDPFTYEIVRRLIRTRYITLVNVAAEDEVAVEFIQGDCRGAALAASLQGLFDDRARARRQVDRQNAALAVMRGGVDNPTEAAGKAVMDVVRGGATVQLAGRAR